MAITGNTIRAARALAGLTAEQAAEAAGIGVASWNRIERAGPDEPGVSYPVISKVLDALAKAGVRVIDTTDEVGVAIARAKQAMPTKVKGDARDTEIGD